MNVNCTTVDASSSAPTLWVHTLATVKVVLYWRQTARVAAVRHYGRLHSVLFDFACISVYRDVVFAVGFSSTQISLCSASLSPLSTLFTKNW